MEQGAEELPLTVDPSLLPTKPTVIPLLQSTERKMRTGNQGGDIAEWAQAALSSKQGDDDLNDTLESLRERALERGKLAEKQAEDLKELLRQEEKNKLMSVLPSIADALRSLSVRKKRTNMIKKECAEEVASSLHLKVQEILQSFVVLSSVVPDFIILRPSAGQLPSTVTINTTLPYKEVRRKVLDYVTENTVVTSL